MTVYCPLWQGGVGRSMGIPLHMKGAGDDVLFYFVSLSLLLLSFCFRIPLSLSCLLFPWYFCGKKMALFCRWLMARVT